MWQLLASSQSTGEDFIKPPPFSRPPTSPVLAEEGDGDNGKKYVDCRGPNSHSSGSHHVVFHSQHFHIPVQLRSTNAITSDFQQVHGLGRQMDLVALRLEEKVREASAAFLSPMKESSTRAALTNQGSSSSNDPSSRKIFTITAGVQAHRCLLAA